MQFNPEQKKAIETINGPLLILAGAGSGKTATMIERVANMINKGVPANSIVALTFTNKAASEMKERLTARTGMQFGNAFRNAKTNPFIGTFHSFGIFLLKRYIDREDVQETIHRKKDFIIYDESDKISIIRDIIKNELGLIEKEYPARQVAYFISDAKSKNIDPKSYELQVDSPIKEVVASVFHRYSKRLETSNALDFDDILLLARQLLDIPFVLNDLQDQYKYFIVDEYQDTNLLQYEIISILARAQKNIAVVGDDWQSIYSWRGADMRNILSFQKDYPQATVIKLEQNYRSTKTIIAAANTLIKKNETSLDKSLWTANVDGEKIVYYKAADENDEAKFITDTIASKYSEEGKYKNNLILYRMNSQSRKLEEGLLKAGIPYRIIGGLKFYDRKEIKDMLGYLKLIVNPLDRVSFLRIVNTPSRKIGKKTIEILEHYSQSFGLGYMDVLENVEEIEEFGPAKIASLKEFYNLYLEFVKLSESLVVAELLSRIIDKLDYRNYLKAEYGSDEALSKEDNLDELLSVASSFNGLEPRESLTTFLEDVSLITDMDTIDNSEDFVSLMTIHTSKGLEQKRVFVAGLEERIFPSQRTMTDMQALEEERRLMYVAMTRAKDELYLTSCMQRFHYGEYKANDVSRFFKEIPKEYIEQDEGQGSSNFSINPVTHYSTSRSSSTRQKNDPGDFSVGDTVKHPKFGNGMIMELNGEIAEILFGNNYGRKKMNIVLAPVIKT